MYDECTMLVFWQWVSASACAAGTAVRETPCNAALIFSPRSTLFVSLLKRKQLQKIIYKRGTYPTRDKGIR